MTRACVIAILFAACGGDDIATVAAPPPPPPRHVERTRPVPVLPVAVAVMDDDGDEDHCPDVPEEIEGDYDSCPDPKPVAALPPPPEVDRDSDDAILDVEDRCPDVPDPSSDDDGCPG